MDISICSYSFHRLLAAGKQDIFQYITTCKELGATYLEPWSGHFRDRPDAERNEPPQEATYITKIKNAAEEVGMPMGCVAVDGAHIYEPEPEARQANRKRAYRWLDIAAELGAKQIRIDSGHRADDWPDDVFQIIVEGYNDLIARGRDKGVEVIIENHWGPSKHPENLVKLLETVDGLGLLFDTNNWAEGKQEKAWEMCAKYATATHVKTFSFDEKGNDPSVDLAKAMNILRDAGYNGIWGIESVPRDGDEYEGARKTIALIKRVLGE